MELLNTRSGCLRPKALAALNRIGDQMLPRNGDYPAFSELGCIEHVDLVLAHADPHDVAQLDTALTILHYMPTVVLGAIVRLTQTVSRWPGRLATPFRLFDLGLRGLIVTLYYSGRAGAGYTGKTPQELVGFTINAVRR